MWTELEFPSLRLAERDVVLNAIRHWEDRGRGGVVFIAAAPGSGRTRLLADVRRAIEWAGGNGIVIAGSLKTGSFDAGGITPAERRRIVDASADIGELVGVVLKLLGLPVDVTELVGLVVAKSAAALRLAEQVREGMSQRGNDSRFVAELLAEAANERRLTLLLDDLDGDRAGWASQLLHDMAPAAAEGLPLTVVATGDGPVQPPRPSRGLPDFLHAAAELQAQPWGEHDELDALWLPLEPITLPQLTAALRCAPTVAGHLWDASGGRLSAAEELWMQWGRQGLLRLDDDGLVCLTPDADVLGQQSVYRMALERVRSLLVASQGPRDESRLPDNDTETSTIRALQIGALEGERFTADAIARVMGRDRDDVVDLLDPALLVATNNADGLLHELEHEVVIGADGVSRNLCPYRFAGTIVWLAFRNNGLVPAKRRELAGQLVQALSELHGDTTAISSLLAVLSVVAQDPEASLRWQAKAERGRDPALLRWRAHMAIGADTSAWTRSHCAHVAGLLIDAYWAVGRGAALSESRAIVAEAVRLATVAEDEWAEARALEASAVQASGDEDWVRAVRDGQRAVDLYDALGLPESAADVAITLARTRLKLCFEAGVGELSEVVPAVRALLLRARRDGHAIASGTALSDLALLAGLDSREAADDLEASLSLLPRRGRGAEERGIALGRLSYVATHEGDLEKAHSLLAEAVRLQRETGDPFALSAALHMLAAVDIGLGRFDAARANATEALKIADALGARQGAVLARISLGASEAFLGHREPAFRRLDEANAIAGGALAEVHNVAALLPEVLRAHAAGLVGPPYGRDADSVQRRAADMVRVIVG